MSRIDDNNDAQRMAELNEAQLRRRLDNEKRLNQKRTERAFNEVLGQQGRLRQTKDTTSRNQTAHARSAAQEVLARVRKDAPKTPAELARRAALSHAMHGQMAKVRTQNADAMMRDEALRADDLMTRGEREVEHVQKSAHTEEDQDVVRIEEQQAEIEQNQLHGALDAVGDDPRRQRQGHGGDSNRERRSNDGVAAPERAQGARPTQVIPPEVLKQLVGTIYKASQDGRTHLQLTLKGGMFDGVHMVVRSENGKVSCEFGNCDRNLGRLLKSSQGALARGLSRRGLTLQSLSVR